jgi:hypothetical protein
MRSRVERRGVTSTRVSRGGNPLFSAPPQRSRSIHLVLVLLVTFIVPPMLARMAAASDLFSVTQGAVLICEAEINDDGLVELPDGKQTCTPQDAMTSSDLTGQMMVDRMGSVWDVPSLRVDLSDDLELDLGLGFIEVSDVSLKFPIESESGWPAKMVATLGDDLLRFDGDCDDDACTGPTPFIVQLDYTLFFEGEPLVLANAVEFDHSDDGETATVSGTAELGAVIPLGFRDLAYWMSAQITFVPEPTLPLAQAGSLAILFALARSRRRAR